MPFWLAKKTQVVPDWSIHTAGCDSTWSALRHTDHRANLPTRVARTALPAQVVQIEQPQLGVLSTLHGQMLTVLFGGTGRIAGAVLPRSRSLACNCAKFVGV